MRHNEHPLWPKFVEHFKATHPTCWPQLGWHYEWEAYKAGASNFEGLFRTACLWVWKGLDAPGQTLESTIEAMKMEHDLEQTKKQEHKLEQNSRD